MKRGFTSERDAEKALGRAQAKRSRQGQARGTMRGLKVESRFYECEHGSFHLTSESRASYENRVGAW
ncbi:hypothetical protein KGG85_gp58 [Streptomyces phage Tefunt]|uniref:Uncharacterized protein n=1 Tax=Streptomyces phage Tefunt TaxID=2041209 RepID=A0A291LI02_9CAUD|nr:hypothetical protein KGG85_gp58 [Streptomyces phage Tefunt]ATI18998.1 hypothetical protein SEA_TEFUNT_58 [Streptomyces phage Tefunt]AXH70262.1 hypothetical protein SEA_HAIZUM_58 [Streptomyces phage Haizum]QAY15800.1 hypothetical protein SEA_NISHIKIGOI_59 [Streptomyces phage Nishikigoi]